MRTTFVRITIACVLATVAAGANGVPTLFDYGLNIDGTVTLPFDGDPIAAEVDISAFDEFTGLGALTVTISGAGTHSVSAFFDHDFDLSTTFFDEFGETSGTADAGLSWEIDDAEFGDIFANFISSGPDNTNAVPGIESDIALSMGFLDFMLGAGETAVVEFLLSQVEPAGFYLRHFDPAENDQLFLQASLSITGPRPVPEPSTLMLLLAGALVALRRKGSAG